MAPSEELTRLVMAAQPVATEDYQVASLREAAVADEATFLDTEAVRAQVNSPTYLAGSLDSEGSAGVQPARLAWGLAAACERIGIRIAERTPATGLASDADGVTVRTPSSPGTSSARSRSWKASGSAIAGAARSTRAAGSARSSAPRTAAGSPTRSATPGWG